jgi:hypothetical protein
MPPQGKIATAAAHPTPSVSRNDSRTTPQSATGSSQNQAHAGAEFDVPRNAAIDRPVRDDFRNRPVLEFEARGIVIVVVAGHAEDRDRMARSDRALGLRR